MTKRRDISPSPEPLEAYAEHFDDLFEKSNQREEFRRYLEGLLLPTERHKTLTGLVNTEPLVGAKPPRAQKLQWFLSESTWDERKIEAKRLELLREDASTTPNGGGVLVIDETGDRKDGHKTAHVGRHYLGKPSAKLTMAWSPSAVCGPTNGSITPLTSSPTLQLPTLRKGRKIHSSAPSGSDRPATGATCGPGRNPISSRGN